MLADGGEGRGKNRAGKVIGYRGSYFDPAGKRRYVSAKNKGDAEKALRQAMTDADRGLVLDAGTLTVGEYLERWLSDCLAPLVDAGKVEHSTYVRYAGIVGGHISPMLGRKKLRDLGRTDIRALYSAKGKELSSRSVDYIHVTLQKALSQAMRDDLINRNVARGERPRSSRKREEIKALSSEQARALLSTARGERNEALYVVAVHAGLRQGELLGLKWADIDLAASRLSVRRALKVTDHGLDFGPPKNNASRRSTLHNRYRPGTVELIVDEQLILPLIICDRLNLVRAGGECPKPAVFVKLKFGLDSNRSSQVFGIRQPGETRYVVHLTFLSNSVARWI